MTNISCIPLNEPATTMADYQVQPLQESSKVHSVAVAVPTIALPAISSSRPQLTVAAAAISLSTHSNPVVCPTDLVYAQAVDLESGELCDSQNGYYSSQRKIRIIYWVLGVTFLVLGGIGVLVAFVLTPPK